LAVFGYVTAAVASFFVGRNAENDDAELAGAKQLAILQEEVMTLRDDIPGADEAAAGVVKRVGTRIPS